MSERINAKAKSRVLDALTPMPSSLASVKSGISSTSRLLLKLFRVERMNIFLTANSRSLSSSMTGKSDRPYEFDDDGLGLESFVGLL
jgi:hypothetical protein